VVNAVAYITQTEESFVLAKLCGHSSSLKNNRNQKQTMVKSKKSKFENMKKLSIFEKTKRQSKKTTSEKTEKKR
jgi:hypothetical protein